MVHFAHPHAFVFEDSGAEVEAVAFLSQTEYRVLCYIPYIWQLKEYISHMPTTARFQGHTNIWVFLNVIA